jgi:hypothetical protein
MSEVQHPLLVLTPRPWKWVKVLLGGLAFVAVGVWMLHRDRSNVLLAWSCVIFFALIAIVALLQLMPGMSHMVITRSGLHIKTLFRSYSYAWDDIEEFGVAEWSQWHGPFRQRHRLVGMNFKAGSEPLRKAGRLVGLSAGLTGYHGALSDNYGYKHQELADLLNKYLSERQGRTN